MHINLTKNIFGDVNIDHSNLIGIFGPKNLEGKRHSDDEIIKAIKNPIGTKPLHETAKGCKGILIITDDNTRETPLSSIIPPILDELKVAKVPDNGITFLIGLGTHRPMTHDEIKIKFGVEISDKFKIINHEWNKSELLVSLGRCNLGFEIVINKLVKEVDLIISVGNIVPHATTGFSGGGKTLIPGICGEKTIEDTHWQALSYPMSEILGKLKNPIRDAINSICRKVNLRMIVNTVLLNGKVYGMVAGDLELAHNKGVELCREIYEVLIPEKADIVIAEAYPNDIDLRQAIKAICTADLVCRDGGVIILPAECVEGIAPQFPEFLRYGFKNSDLLYQEVVRGKFKQKLMAYTLVAIGRIISKRVKAILISPNINSTQADQLGFIWALNLQQAVNKAIQMVGKNSRMTVLKQASKLLPVIQF